MHTITIGIGANNKNKVNKKYVIEK